MTKTFNKVRNYLIEYQVSSEGNNSVDMLLLDAIRLRQEIARLHNELRDVGTRLQNAQLQIDLLKKKIFTRDLAIAETKAILQDGRKDND